MSRSHSSCLSFFGNGEVISIRRILAWITCGIRIFPTVIVPQYNGSAILPVMSDDYPIKRIASFALVDPAINEWCSTHSLHLFTDYKDYDVRSVDIVGSNGKKCQVWIDPPENENVTVHVCPYVPQH